MTKLIFRHDNDYFLAIKMLTKERFQEVDTPNLVLNLCSYRDDIEKYDFLQTYYQWCKEILISRWQKEWIDQEVFFENVEKERYNDILLLCSTELFHIWDFLKTGHLKK